MAKKASKKTKPKAETTEKEAAPESQVDPDDPLAVLIGAQTPDQGEPDQNPPDVDMVSVTQDLLQAQVDGRWGPQTDRRSSRMRTAAMARHGHPRRSSRSFDAREVQRIVGTEVDGVWGEKSDEALAEWIKRVQEVLDVKVDGLWGPRTDSAFMAIRRSSMNPRR